MAKRSYVAPKPGFVARYRCNRCDVTFESAPGRHTCMLCRGRLTFLGQEWREPVDTLAIMKQELADQQAAWKEAHKPPKPKRRRRAA